ncbi:MAG: hypothetical protein AB7J35_18780 [Dehalococcoidia bacterium]
MDHGCEGETDHPLLAFVASRQRLIRGEAIEPHRGLAALAERRIDEAERRTVAAMPFVSQGVPHGMHEEPFAAAKDTMLDRLNKRQR